MDDLATSVPAAGSTAEGDLTEVDTEQLAAQICVFAGQLAAHTCRWLELIAEFDRRHGWSGEGIQSCAHWVAWACSMSAGTAREHVRVARALDEMPLVHASFASGELSYSKVREVTRVVGRVAEEFLLELARTATASQLERAVRGFRRSDPDRLKQEIRRSVRWHNEDDGSLRLVAVLPAEEGAAVAGALELAIDRLREERRAARRADVADDRDGRRADDDRARRIRAGEIISDCEDVAEPFIPVNAADAFLLVAEQFMSTAPADASGADRTTVVVHVDAPTLLRAVADEPVEGTVAPSVHDATAVSASGACQVGDVGVTPATAARLACDARVVGVVRGLDGCVLHHGTSRRLVSPAQRRALMIRDGCCRYPSCRRTTNLEAHHVVHWALGGPTDLDNLVLVCRFHHLAVHEGIAVLTAERDAPDGRVRFVFRRSDGTELTPAEIARRRADVVTEYHETWRQLAHSSWHSDEARAIRPLWAGERVDMAAMVGALFGHKLSVEKQVA